VRFALALLAGISAAALLFAAVTWLRRRSFLVRQLAFPIYASAAAAGVEAFRLVAGPAYPQADRLLTWCLLFLGFATVLRLLGLFLFDVHLQQKGLRLPPLLPAVSMFLVYLLAGFITLKVTFPQYDITPLVATSAVTSLVLGLALQPILGNFFAGLVISLEKPFRLNDWIRVGEHEGRVVAITWRTTHLRTRDNDNIVIPNGRLADERVVNYYYPHPTRMERVRVGVHYKTPPYRARRALLAAVEGVAGVMDKPTPDVFTLAFLDSAIEYELRVWIEDVAQGPRIASDLRARIWEELQREGIAIPYPTRTLEIAPRERPRRTEAGVPAARLFVAEGAERGRTLELDGAPVTLGRSRSCTFSLSDANASKEHLKIEWTPEGYVMTDLGSSFGTRVNGAPASRAVLRPLDRIAVGETVMVFESEGPPPLGAGAPGRVAEPEGQDVQWKEAGDGR
jgi:small-conductance mechanosensitive channel